MISLWKARFRTLVDQLRFGNLTLDQSMVLQGKAFYAYHEKIDVAVDGTIQAYIKAPANKSLIVSSRVLAAETSGVEYRVFGGVIVTAGTGTPKTLTNRNSKLNYPSETVIRIDPSFDNPGSEIDYEPHYPSAAGEAKKPTDETFDDGDIKEIGPGQELRTEYKNTSSANQTLFIRFKVYEVDTDGVHAGRIDNY